jgi:hypothetical protein
MFQGRSPELEAFVRKKTQRVCYAVGLGEIALGHKGYRKLPEPANPGFLIIS